MPVIDAALAHRVVDRLAPDDTTVDLDGLRAVYAAWCRSVPFDNLVKRIHLASGDAAPPPNGDPTAFFESWLEHGTGGTCWPSSIALWALLDALGYPARLASCCMADTLDPNLTHTHGTVLVRFADDAADWWVDTSMLLGEPLPIEEGASIARARTERLDGGAWRVWWRVHLASEEMSCRLLTDPVDVAHCQARYEWSRGAGPFNASAYAVTWRGGSMVAVRRGVHAVQDARGERTETRAIDDAEMRRVLIEDFGYSEAIVAALPTDETPAPAG